MRTQFVLLAMFALSNVNLIFTDGTVYTPSVSTHRGYKFNLGWKFIRPDVTGADKTGLPQSQLVMRVLVILN
jgi:hypothetical protein